MGSLLALSLALGLSWTQGGPLPDLPRSSEPIRIEVRHADPYLIVALLKGLQPPFPELSTLGIFGYQFPLNESRNPFVRGLLIVNPADNSILFFPEREDR
ncbi:MAG: hypothetical protein HND42_09295 [Armatimonadetes bacterium]|nr:MAG: hypothetical protein EDM73_07980 [Armatimonadota bacterium]MCE7900341.1 hypothetical protein [Armatimonadetes bacterium ATM1]MDL1928495.1 hypothetical protein [Fimbriimonadia bacterium ATM]MBC6969885.1 hypothetical protein [Armatimonadota bacterium]MBL1150387.1 hypothetical protein [Armatimonadota bacterium]